MAVTRPAGGSSTDATLAIRQIVPTFAAEVAGMPIHGDVSPELISQFIAAPPPLSRAHRSRASISTPSDLVAFSRRLGPLEIHSRFENTLPTHREIFCVGNVERDGMKASFNRGVEQWHADSSYRETPSDASLFYAEIVPDEGGDTLFADATAAWRALDPETRAQVEGLYGVHSLETLRQWGQRHNPERGRNVDDQAAAFPPVRQPLVRRHPVTGAKSLYVCPAVISHVEGLDPAEGAALIETLIAHVTQPRFVYATAGTRAIW